MQRDFTELSPEKMWRRLQIYWVAGKTKPPVYVDDTKIFVKNEKELEILI